MAWCGDPQPGMRLPRRAGYLSGKFRRAPQTRWRRGASASTRVRSSVSSVAIIGAGITGLTAAFYLKRQGIDVTVYESGDRVGGVIQSLRQDGYLAEFGPNTIL